MNAQRRQQLEARKEAMRARMAKRPSVQRPDPEALQARLEAKRAAMPDPEAVRARLDARRAQAPDPAALRARVDAKRAALEEKKPDKERRRRPWWLLLLLIPWFFLRDCSCNEPVPAPAPEPEPAPAGPPVAVPEPEPERPLPGGRVDRIDRPELQLAPPTQRPWIGAFRMQVAARGPRLATCFEGAANPGRLKWSTAVEPGEGRVSDHTIEPILMTHTLSPQQRTCLVEVLTDPPYTLQAGDEPETPSRVSLVIEF